VDTPDTTEAEAQRMITAFYGRRSKEQQNVSEDERSVTRQLDHARAYAQAKGWELPAELVFSDEISGAEFERRPGLMRLLGSLRPRPSFRALIVYNRDRLGREQIETAYIIKQLIQAGVRVFESRSDGGELTLDSPTDKVLLAVTTFANELEREAARQRTADAMIQKARAGHCTGGRVFGYDNVPVRNADGERLHVMRVVNETEAAVVILIFELCAQGYGLRRIAHELNEQGQRAPRPRNDRPVGWAPSSVREVLHRELYRGALVWNRTKKRDAWGQKRSTDRDPKDWIRKDVPTLRIVSEELWNAAHERLGGSREAYLQSTDGHVWGRPLNGVESKYLLTGLANCGICGGSFTARSRKHGRQRLNYYQCQVNLARGRAICSNDLIMPLREAETAVRHTVEHHLLRADVIADALAQALAQLQPPAESRDKHRKELEGQLAKVELELGRLTEAIVAGGNVNTIVEAVQDRDRRRSQLRQELQALHQLAKASQIDRAEVEARLTGC
jgi:DNA invertase Pin-like site-specific DNA recombinase